MNGSLSIINTPLDALSLATIVLLGGVLAVVQKRVFRVERQLALVLYAWHTLFSFAYIFYSLNNPADSTIYYINSLFPQPEYGLGTDFIVIITRFLTSVLSLSYGGAFMVFNIFGFIGMLALVGALQEVAAGSKPYVTPLMLIVMLLPGLSFWSSAIGKDALTFLGAGLTCWAMLSPQRRAPAIVVALLVFTVVRPHIAGILTASVALALLFFLRTGIVAKAVLAMLATPAALVMVIFGLQYAGVDNPTDITSITERVEMQQGRNLEGGSSISIAEMSIPVRMFSYLFRPMFVDASSVLGIVASLENLILFVIITWASLLVVIGRAPRSKFYVAFCAVFALATLVVLSSTTANLGIALRQKWMFIPMLLVVAFSIIGRPRALAYCTTSLGSGLIARRAR